MKRQCMNVHHDARNAVMNIASLVRSAGVSDEILSAVERQLTRIETAFGKCPVFAIEQTGITYDEASGD